MLTLTNALSIEGHTVYRDDSSSMHFYVLPDKHPPSVALDENGRPLFSLIVYRRDEDRVAEGEEFGGGIMTFTAEIPVEDRDLKRIKSKLRRQMTELLELK